VIGFGYGERGITPRIARRGIESSERLGRHRWRGERTLSWLHQYRRLRVRYEQRDDIHQAFLSLGCALICWKQIQWFCWALLGRFISPELHEERRKRGSHQADVRTIRGNGTDAR
jgi:hypothetical protein